MKRPKNPIWIAVKVERGFPSSVRAFSSEELALTQHRIWEQQINRDYDESDYFSLNLEQIDEIEW